MKIDLPLKTKEDKITVRFPTHLNIKKDLKRAMLKLKKAHPKLKVNINNVCVWAVRKFIDDCG